MELSMLAVVVVIAITTTIVYQEVVIPLFRKREKSTPENLFQETEKILGQIRETVNAQLLGTGEKSVQLFNAIAQQKMILNKNSRKAIAIFLSPGTFKLLIRNELGNKKATERVDHLYEILHDLEMPVGHLGELPIYVSEFLVDAPVFVAGGITWELEE